MPLEQLAELRAAIAAAAARPGGVAVLTGAGMSAESGIATFRDAMTGMWAHIDPAQLASEAGFRADPARVWAWYAERRVAVRAAQPNTGHVALAVFARRHPQALTVITQNVDDLHQRAGLSQTLRLHGNLLADRWLSPCPRVQPCATAAAESGVPPVCAACGNLLRPDVVWFGEALPWPALRQAEQAAEDAAVLLVVGTSGLVWPAAGLAGQARRAGARVVIVNPEPSELDAVAHHIVRASAATALPRLLAESPVLD
jgi:NAD-dependent deacetylase